MSVSARKSRQLDKVLQLLLPKSYKVLQSISVLQSVTTPPPHRDPTSCLCLRLGNNVVPKVAAAQSSPAEQSPRLHLQVRATQADHSLTSAAVSCVHVSLCNCVYCAYNIIVGALFLQHSLTHSLHWWTIIAAVGKSPHMRVRGQHL